MAIRYFPFAKHSTNSVFLGRTKSRRRRTGPCFITSATVECSDIGSTVNVRMKVLVKNKLRPQAMLPGTHSAGSNWSIFKPHLPRIRVATMFL